MDQILRPDLYLEKNASQQPAIDLLRAMGYIYISPEDCAMQRGSSYHVLLRDILRGQLRRLNRYIYAGAENEFSAANIERAMEDLDEPLTDGLVRTSEKIYDALLLGKSYPETVGDGKMLSFNLRYIDWEHPENNLYHVTGEYVVEGQDKQHNARPDIVLFINGIPFAVIECKVPQISVDQAVEQTVRNQQADYIPQLFKYAQIVMATNKNAVKYATAGTPKKFWNVWKEQNEAFMSRQLVWLLDDRMPTEQDKNIISLFSKERVMEIMRYFILYDANVKKICRYQQYFAIKEIVKTIGEIDERGNRQSGVIWHTQGSGKSLTMVMLAKYILMELTDCHPRVVIVTDRKELDGQIAATFAHTRLNPARATSGRHLVELVNSGKADVITSIINKFNTAERMATKNESRDVFILVDESHRSNYGLMATKMRSVFPNACYIGFTGTPLMKKEKNTMSTFGKLIHKYTIKDGVDDGAIVPLIYEGRFVDQNVDEENIDLWFEQTTKRLTDAQKEDLAKKWSSIRRLTSTDARIKRIALDINTHFIEGYKNTGFKAMLATNYKRDAVRYLECFEQFGDLTCAVVISPPDMRESVDDMDEGTDDKVVAYWNKMMRQYGDADRYEEAIKNKFCDGEIDILIVCSKLLTGFDAPICQVLYIDKELKEHGLLQAIARTNRLHEGKDYGLIVDYRGLIEKLDTAMDMYSGAGLENFDSGDLKGAVVDVMSSVGTLRDSYTRLVELFVAVRNKADAEEVEVFLADNKIREDFYNLLCAFGKALNLVLNSEQAYAAVPKDELKKYQSTFIFFAKVRRSVKIRYCDAIDNSEYEPLMQNLLDTHLSVAGVRQITSPINILNKDDFEKELDELGSLRAKADAITSRMTKSISEKYDENPAYYGSFSKRIKDALDQYKEQVITEAEYLAKMRTIMEDYHAGRSSISYPESIKNNVHAQAFYGVLSAILDDDKSVSVEPDFVAEIAEEITKIIAKHSQVDWTNNKTIHDRISQDIDDLFYEYEKTRGMKLSFDVVDKIIENVKTVALRRF
ncbi:type I restriction endonuclease subunit R [Lachnotalea sp. AF33-28]|uniref:type I restriction endonuclease subunit R n=1 Tax=Lachnotalea sp. AF33-28 TaxID=2292046 RepID=UPI000E4E9C74|nr:type I restriction endonuclease subunit R [Lachnotalea sp. AF33-28]RHP34550.1 type I restriction endonuclease subunit R [Lachnotalea sp. AF33-28]